MSAGIKPIDGDSVHRIHSGQVVLDLQGALKELVENALDAGATSIEVRIRDNGLSSIEVVDNGSGIAEQDWPSIGLKHHTSKLPSLELLPSVSTFGFRGEALSALCALCESVTVTTATKDMEPMGAVIKIGRDGKVLDDTARVARPRGTTINLTGLFAPLPVRRKEYERNAKRELSKALTLLTAYALVPASSSPLQDRAGVRLKVEAISGGAANGKGGKRNMLLSNDGRGDLRAGVTGVWGIKALEGVQEMDIAFEVPLDRMAQRVTGSQLGPAQTNALQADDPETDGVAPPAGLQVKVTGLVSSASWGMGRSSADRQYFYINGRPVDAKPLQKALNEVYKSFNTHQVPLAVLDFHIPRDSIDINVSPDKRTILLHSETNLIAAFREALEAFFAPSRNSFAVNGATQTVRGLKMTQSTLSMAAGNGNAVNEGSQLAASTVVGADNLLDAEPDPITQDGSAGPGLDAAESRPVGIGLDEINPFNLTSTAAGSVGGPLSAEEEVDSETELERFDASPITRRPAQLLAPSMQSRRASNEPITVLDEEEEEEEEHMPSRRSVRVGGDDRHEVDERADTAQVQLDRASTTISTATASWSPARKNVSAAGSQSYRLQASSGRATPAKTGREARKSLRERLAVYSQIPGRRTDDRDDDEMEENSMGIAGPFAASKAKVAPDGEAREELDITQDGHDGDEGEDELESDKENVAPSPESRAAASRRRPRKARSPTADDVDDQDPAEALLIDQESDEEVDCIGKARGIVIAADSTDQDRGQAEAGEREKVRDDNAEMDEDGAAGRSDLASSTSHRPRESMQPDRRFRDEITALSSTGSMVISFDLSALQMRAAKRRKLTTSTRLKTETRRTDLNARLAQAGVSADAGIANRDLSSAEAALSRTVSKADFARMTVVGQFNKGFVIARCRSDDADGETRDGRAGVRGQDDLYIVDQHASDEKYNFETLQRETRIKAQKLIKPRSLQLTAADEIVAMENLDILKANGFEVEIDEDKPPGRGERVKLVAMPVSKETVFDYRDLEQLLHLLSDSAHSASAGGHGQMVRCTKARAMFAMRACRKSIMIGKSLTKPQMSQLLRNMGTIEQPWNCPHGRPTMRHLTAIDSSTLQTGRQAIDWQRRASEQDQE